MKRENFTSPKMFDLASRLGVSRFAAIGIVTLMRDFAAIHSPAGDIGKWPDGSIAGACDWNGDAATFVASLVDAGWLLRDEGHRLLVSDWETECEQWVGLRVRKLKLAFAKPTMGRSAEAPAGSSAGGSLPLTLNPNTLLPSKPPGLPEEREGDFGSDDSKQRSEIRKRAALLLNDLTCLDTALENGCSLAEVMALVCFALANRGRWKSPGGALHARLTNASPGRNVADGWPDESPSAAKKCHGLAEADEARRRKEDVETAAKSERSVLARQQRAAQFGVTLDALDGEALEVVAERAFPYAPSLREWREAGRSRDGKFRNALLRQLESDRAPNARPVADTASSASKR